MFFSILLLSMLVGVMGPLFAVFNDSCNLASDLPQEMDTYLRPLLDQQLPLDARTTTATLTRDSSSLMAMDVDMALGALKTCLDPMSSDPNLAAPLQAEFMNYLDQIDLSSLETLGPLDTRALFSQFYDMRDEAAGISPSSFGLHDDNITAVARVCDTCTGWTDVNPQNATCDGRCADVANCEQQRQEACALATNMTHARDYIRNTSAAVVAMFDTVGEQIEDLSMSVEQLVVELNATRDAVAPYIEHTAQISLGQCGFMATGYAAMVNGMCGSPSSLSGMLWLFVSLAVVCAAGVCIIVTMMYINCRCGRVGQDDHNQVKEIGETLQRTWTQGVRSASSLIKRISSRNLAVTEGGVQMAKYAPRETELPGDMYADAQPCSYV